MPQVLPFVGPATLKAIDDDRDRLKEALAKAKLAEEGPAEPMDEGTFRFWCKAHPKWAKLFNKIVDRWSYSNGKVPGTPGRWAVYPVKEWADAAGLKLRTAETALAALEAEGLIERQRHAFGGKTVFAFIRPTALALNLAGKSDLIPRLGKPAIPPSSGPFSGPISGPIGGPISGPISGSDPTTVTKITSLTLKNKVGDAFGIATGPDQFQDYEGSEQGKEEPPAPATVAEAWQQAVAKNQPGEAVKALTDKERGQLKQIAKDCPEGHAMAVVECIVERWIKFCERAHSHAGGFDYPALPQVAYAAKYRAVAVNFWLGKNGLILVDGQPVPKPEPQSVAAKAPAMPVSAVPAQPAEQMATLEEILASLDETAS